MVATAVVGDDRLLTLVAARVVSHHLSGSYVALNRIKHTEASMKVKLGGFDPDLGRRFAEENGSFILARGRVSSSTAEDEMPPGLDAQQQHDWLMEHPDAHDPTLDEDE